VEEIVKENPVFESKSVQAILIDSIVPPNTPMNLSLRLTSPTKLKKSSNEAKKQQTKPTEPKIPEINIQEEETSKPDVEEPVFSFLEKRPLAKEKPTKSSPGVEKEIEKQAEKTPTEGSHGPPKEEPAEKTTKEDTQGPPKGEEQVEKKTTEDNQEAPDIDPILGYFLGCSPSSTNKSKSTPQKKMVTSKTSKTQNTPPVKQRSSARLAKKVEIETKVEQESIIVNELKQEISSVRSSISTLEKGLKVSLKNDLTKLSEEIKTMLNNETKLLHDKLEFNKESELKSEAVKSSINAMETTLKAQMKKDFDNLSAEIKTTLNSEIKQLHQRLDVQNSKSNEQFDISKQFQLRLESIVDQIDQLNTGVNQVLLNKIQNLDDKTAQLAKTIESIIMKRDEPTEGKQKRKSIDQSNDQNQKRRRLSKERTEKRSSNSKRPSKYDEPTTRQTRSRAVAN